MSFVEKALRLEGVVMKKWPSFYDFPTLVTFLTHCQNAIILVSNPCKKDSEHINQLLDEKIIKNINFSLWIITEPSPDIKKELNLDKLEIILDLSVEKNFNICRTIYDDMVDQRLESFIDHSYDYVTTAVKEKQKGFGLD